MPAPRVVLELLDTDRWQGRGDLGHRDRCHAAAAIAELEVLARVARHPPDGAVLR
jgi:hypothetical protein